MAKIQAPLIFIKLNEFEPDQLSPENIKSNKHHVLSSPDDS